MFKKHLSHFNRGLMIGLESLGLLAVMIFVTWLLLIVRLSQGPMDVEFLAQALEKGLNQHQSTTGLQFHIGTTQLVWGGANQPFEFDIKNIQVDRADNTPVLFIRKIAVQLSKRDLVFGRIVPRVVKVHSPRLRITRGLDGRFLFNMQDETSADNIDAPDAADRSMTAARDVIALLADKTGPGFLSGVEQVSIINATIVYNDLMTNTQWKSRRSRLMLSRTDQGLFGDTFVRLEQGDDDTEEQAAYIRANVNYDKEARTSAAIVYFSGVNPSFIAAKVPQLAAVADIAMPFRGSVALDFNADLQPGIGRFVLGADAGTFNAAGLYPSPIAVKNLYANGGVNFKAWDFSLDEFRVDLEGPVLSAQAKAQTNDDGSKTVTATATLEQMPIDNLRAYWPPQLGEDAYDWVVNHLSVGVATHSTLDIGLTVAADEEKSVTLDRLGGEINFKGIKVDYFAPLMPVTEVDGRATYDPASFTIDVSAGKLEDMNVSNGRVAITGLDPASPRAHIDITAHADGPLKTALKLLDGKPLGYPRDMGLDSATTGGTSGIDIRLNFPLYEDLTLPEINVTAKATVNDVSLKKIVAGLDLTGGPLTLSLDKGILDINGTGKLGTMPVNFDWLQNFKTNTSRVEAKTSLDAVGLAAFGVPGHFNISGTMPTRAIFTIAADKTGTLALTTDLKPTGFSIPMADVKKSIGTAGTLDMTLHLDKDSKPVRISGLALSTEGVQLKGDLSFAADGMPNTVKFDTVKIGETDISIGANRMSDGGYRVSVTGKQVDISSLINGDNTPNSDAEAAKPVIPLTLSMAVNRLVTGQDRNIHEVKLYLHRNGWGRIDQMEVEGQAGRKPLSLSFKPVAQGYTLRLQADNAGAALMALNLTSDIRGGKIIVNGYPLPGGGKRDMAGSVSLTDFTLVNAPAFGRLLNAMSLNGFVELLNGRGISFKKTRGNFEWIDHGQPEQQKNIRLIRIKDGETSGASIGLTVEGNVDLWAKTLDLNGTIIPVSGLNKALDSIPLVGDILTGGGKGVFAATYTVKGPSDDPTVKVNPLSVLAPGILRKLFFEK